MIIYVDAGNTAVKFYQCLDRNWQLLLRQPTDNLLPYDQFLSLLTNRLPCSAKQCELWVCSVVPSWTDYFRSLTRNYSFITARFLDFSLPPAGLRFATALNLQRIGADLLALSCFAHQWQNTIVICLGTATTAVVVKNYVVSGYFISPGWRLSYQNLVNKSQLLRSQVLSITTDDSKQPLVGSDTKTALRIGSVIVPWLGVQSWVAMIKMSTTDRSAKWKMVITGGDASLVHDLKGTNKWDYQPFAVVIGLRRWLQTNDLESVAKHHR